jgi:hypothetical protein
MNEAAYFIKDRVIALRCDAKLHPETYDAAAAWVDLARRWAEARGFTELEKEICAAKKEMFCLENVRALTNILILAKSGRPATKGITEATQ